MALVMVGVGLINVFCGQYLVNMLLPFIEPTSKLHEEVRSIGAAQGEVESMSIASISSDWNCSWTLNFQPRYNCTILVQLSPASGEGMSQWAADVLETYLHTFQLGCHLMIGYGEGVDMSHALVPNSDYDWRVPSGYNCSERPDCFPTPITQTKEFQALLGGGRHSMAALPNFRSPYPGHLVSQNRANVRYYGGLKSIFGESFNITESMACAFHSLFRLSPKLVELYQPNLFSEILPALHDQASYSISLYIRTGHTERVHIETEQETTLKVYRNKTQQIVDCALGLEEQAGKDDSSKKKNIVWMVVTDSPYIKEWIHEKYGGANHSHRTIITTRARGAHTKYKRNVPSTADFAEAFLDWWLIGESSDAVVSDSTAPSFGNTAVFRTIKPYYKIPKGGGGQLCELTPPALS
jgi:hypothetical protein